MATVLYSSLEEREKVITNENIDLNQLCANNFMILGTSILFPTIVSRERRNLQQLLRYAQREREKILYYKDRRYLRDRIKRSIHIVNSIEDGKFKREGYNFGFTLHTLYELSLLEKALGEHNIERWANSLKGHLYEIRLFLEDLRERYEKISGMFEKDSEFSTIMASYLLGCPIVTDNYNTFNIHTMNLYRRMFRGKWVSLRKFERLDSQDIINRLRKF